MALTKLGGVIQFPYRHLAVTQEIAASSSLGAAGRQVHLIGQVYLENPTGGSKTISSSGGIIAWRTPSVPIFSNAGTQLDIGIQDLDMTISATPARGDGTMDVSATLIGGTDSLGSSGTKEIAMETGSKTISHGDFIAVAFNMVSRGGSDSVPVSASQQGDYTDGTRVIPCVSTVTSGTWSTLTNGTPQVTIVFDDGTVGWLVEALPPVSQSNISYNSGSTPDEIGNYIKLKTKIRIVGFVFENIASNNSATFDICVYTDPLGSPSLAASKSIDPDQMGTSAGTAIYMLSTPLVIGPGEISVTLKPTTTNNITAYYYQVLTPKYMRCFGVHEDDLYAVSRTDGSGAFAGYNSGTAKDRRMAIKLLVDMVDVAGEAQSSVGIF